MPDIPDDLFTKKGCLRSIFNFVLFCLLVGGLGAIHPVLGVIAFFALFFFSGRK